MDPYTESTRDWLDRRFRAVDDDGTYRAHQPIYGFRNGPTEPGVVKRYTITWRIARALAGLDFTSLADIGGAEGYKAALVRELFGAEVTSCDLSEEACRRAREIYGIEARAIDIHRLPFADGEFDVVLCSETLEHVPGIELATRELLRVARRAVVITVPREPVAVVERNLREKIPHAHIHALDLHSFDWAATDGIEVRAEKLLTPMLRVPRVLADATKRRAAGRESPTMRVYNALCPLLRSLTGRRSAAGLVRLDRVLSSLGPYDGMLIVVAKDPSVFRSTPRRRIRARDVIDFAVPFHRPGPSEPVRDLPREGSHQRVASDRGAGDPSVARAVTANVPNHPSVPSTR